MPDVSGATILDDLPESIITQEIFLRLPTKDVLRCHAVSRSWHGATSTREFLLAHHQCQPSLPFITYCRQRSTNDYVVDSFDIRKVPAEPRPVLRSDHRYPFKVQASCDGLLLLSLPNGRFSIVNPVTSQWIALPRLTGAYGSIAGMYPHPLRSGQYRILFFRGEHEVCKAGYYVLTVGSSKNQKPKWIGVPVAYPCLKDGMLRLHHECRWFPPVVLNGYLHWYLPHSLKDKILLFDTVQESFSSISTPAAASRFDRTLLEMEGTLVMRSLDGTDRIMSLWVLQDYDREASWSLLCQVDQVPMLEYQHNVFLSIESYMFVFYVEPYLRQLHYDDNGRLLEEFQWRKYYYPYITQHWFKESLIRHTFFPVRGGGHVRQPRVFQWL